MDKVVEEVGEENVVKVVIDNEASFKVSNMLLMKKWKHLFWSPCVSHYIDLMLEGIGSMKQIKETLDQAKMIMRFIYSSLNFPISLFYISSDTKSIHRDLYVLGSSKSATDIAILNHRTHLHDHFFSICILPSSRCFFL